MAMVAISVLCSILFWKGKPTAKKVILSLLAGLALLLIVEGFMTHHLCARGNPVLQPLIGASCLIAVGICVAEPRIIVFMDMLLLVASLALSRQYLDLVHIPSLTGNSMEPQDQERRLEYRKMDIVEMLRKEAANNEDFPAGWLLQMYSSFSNPKLRGILTDTDYHPYRIEIRPLWHSWFTRLYGRIEHPMGLWYPGGRMSESVDHIEWRGTTKQ